MANFTTAYEFMMDNEDPEREYREVPDVGGQAISGINSAAFPEDFAAIAATPQAQREIQVGIFYRRVFWNQWISQLVSDDLAERVFDAAVNMGSGTAVKLLQRAVNTLQTEQIATDGTWGPATVAAANTPHSDLVVVAFIQQRKRHYQAIVAMKPELSKYLVAWLARAGK